MNSPLIAARAVARLIGRVACVFAAAMAIVALVYLWLGRPTLAREYRQEEIARFSPTAGHGIGQLAGESLLLSGVVYASRRWLRIRL